jgi:UDP-N-acetylmuramyl pentapeptide phosphotransferase/UDP-N-acetylglucosamine-1-phosphate transferase
MGDTGSLTIGGIIAGNCCPKMLIPLLCGIFLVENLSVVLQVSYSNTPRNALKAEEYFNVAFTSSLSEKAIMKAKLLPVLDCCDYAGFINCYFKIKIT